MAAIIGFSGQQYSAFDPRTIPTCRLWLDGQDSGTFTYSTAPTLTAWTNKANGGTAATATGTPTVSTLNNRPAVQLGTGNYFTGAISPTMTRAGLSYFAVAVTTVPQVGKTQRLLSMAAATGVDDTGTTGVLALYVGDSSRPLTTIRNAVISSTANLTNNAPFQAAGVYSGTNGQLWKDGVAGTGPTSSGSAFAITRYAIGNRAGLLSATDNFWLGTVGEIIVYDRGLSTSERRQVEGYLAWRWGLQASLPVSHPYKGYPPVMRQFIPQDIGVRPAVWFDAADSATLTGAPALTRWSNKGTMGGLAANNLTGAGGTLTTGVSNINGLNAVYMAGFMGIGNLTFVYNERAQFIAYRVDVSTGNIIQGFSTQSFSTYVNPGQRSYLSNNASYARISGTTTNGAAIMEASGPAQPFGVPLVVVMHHANGSGPITVNGTELNKNANASAANYPRNTPVTMFLGSSGTPFVLGELLQYDWSGFTDTQRQQIEGYLAWKWGTNRSLPIAHPYCRNPPYTPLFAPQNVSNTCAIWFDAADLTTLTGTTQVTNWVNKGSLGGNASNAVGSCTSGNIANGLNYVRCPAGAELRTTLTLNTTPRTWCIVARQVTPLTTGTFSGLFNRVTGTGFDEVLVRHVNATTNRISMGPAGTVTPIKVAADISAALMSDVYMTCIVNGPGAATNVLTFNGTSRTLTTSDGALSYTTTSATYRLGTATFNTAIDIMEILFYYDGLGTEDRLRVEGYLAWKWGLQGRLPATHPYSKFRP